MDVEIMINNISIQIFKYYFRIFKGLVEIDQFLILTGIGCLSLFAEYDSVHFKEFEIHIII